MSLQVALAALGLIALALGLAALVPLRSYTIDEVIHALMVRDYARHGSRLILNQALPFVSRAADLPYAVAVEGGLAPIYPPLIQDLAAPLFRAIGLRALVVLNALGLVAASLLTWSVARSLGVARPWLPAAVMALAGPVLVHGLSLWPHTLNLAVVTAATAALVQAMLAPRPPDAGLWGVAAGLAAGVACGLRNDGVLALTALALVPLFVRPPRLLVSATVVLGAVAPILWISAINAVRYGQFWPLTGGPGAPGGNLMSAHVTLGLAGGAAIALLWGLSRLRQRRAVALGLGLGVAAVVGLCAVLMLGPPGWAAALTWRLTSAWRVLVDLGPVDPAQLTGETLNVLGYPAGVAQDGQLAGPHGRILYLGVFKKSLLQSAPWVPLALLVLWPPPEAACAPPPQALARQRLLRALLLLPLAYLGFFAMIGFHGGMSTNMRYLVPAMPLMAIAGAAAMAPVWRLARPRGGMLAMTLGLCLGAVAAAYLVPLPIAYWLILWVPVAIAVVVAALALWQRLRPHRGGRAWRLQAAATLAVAWALATALLQDVLPERLVRAAPVAAADALLDHAPDGATLLLDDGPGTFLHLILEPMVARDLDVLRPGRVSDQAFRDILDALSQRATPTLILAAPPEDLAIVQAVQALGHGVQSLAPVPFGSGRGDLYLVQWHGEQAQGRQDPLIRQNLQNDLHDQVQ